MASHHQLARPYAKAVFELARDAGQFKEWSAQLGLIAGVVAQPEVAALITHPALTRNALSGALIEGLGSALSPEGANLVRTLVENRRLQAAGALAVQFEQLRAEAERRINVEITAAVEVPAAQQKLLAQAIAGRLQREVEISWKADPAILGGAVIRADDLVIDGSVRGELERLQAALAR